jgi:hypothetical protein
LGVSEAVAEGYRMKWLLLLLAIGCGSVDIAEEAEDEDLLSHGGDEIGQLRQAWGGVAADGWGLEDGNTDIIPASGDRFYWYPYNDATNDDTWDVVSVAMASLDAEVQSLRMPHYKPPSGTTLAPDEVLLSVSLKGETGNIPDECLDTEPGTPCTLGMAQCLAITTTGAYDLCHHYRLSLFWGRIVANTAARHSGDDPEDVLHSVTRHEVTHSLGFRHGDGGPMSSGHNPLTACQLQTLETYQPRFEATTWIYEPGCLP